MDLTNVVTIDIFGISKVTEGTYISSELIKGTVPILKLLACKK